MNDYKIVKFHEYCKKCKHRKEDETKDPCNECLTVAGQIDTRVPINFEEAGGKLNGKR